MMKPKVKKKILNGYKHKSTLTINYTGHLKHQERNKNKMKLRSSFQITQVISSTEEYSKTSLKLSLLKTISFRIWWLLNTFLFTHRINLNHVIYSGMFPGSVFYLWLSMVPADERRCSVCDILSHWLASCLETSSGDSWGDPEDQNQLFFTTEKMVLERFCCN